MILGAVGIFVAAVVTVDDVRRAHCAVAVIAVGTQTIIVAGARIAGVKTSPGIISIAAVAVTLTIIITAVSAVAADAGGGVAVVRDAVFVPSATGCAIEQLQGAGVTVATICFVALVIVPAGFVAFLIHLLRRALEAPTERRGIRSNAPPVKALTRPSRVP